MVNTDNSFPFRPTYDNLVVVPDIEDEKRGAIIIPDMAKKALTQGKVIAMGPACGRADIDGWMPFKVGDTVIWALHTEQRIGFDGKQYYVLKDSDVLLVSTQEK